MKYDSHNIFMYLFISTSCFLLGGFAWDTKLLSDKVHQEKKQSCIAMYKQMPVDTLADSFCDEFFTILRGD